MPTRYRAILLVFLAGLACVFPACYTLLQHPRLANMDYSRPESDRCLDCHTASELWRFHHSPSTPVYAGTARSSWGYYYDLPWWYDAYWDYDEVSEPETIPMHEPAPAPETYATPPPLGVGAGEPIPHAGKKQTATSAAAQKKKAKGDNGAKDNSDSDKRPVRAKTKKKKKDTGGESQ
jgi:hypothetical protein